MTNKTTNPLDNLSPEVRQKYQAGVDEALATFKNLTPQTLEVLRRRLRNRENISKKEIFQSLVNPTDAVATKELNAILEDLTRKSMGIMDKVKAQDGWAVGFIWETTQDKKAVCAHQDRNRKFYVFRDCPAVKDGFVAARNGIQYADQLLDGMPSVAPGCRCVARYVYNLKSVPEEILTKKGESFVAHAQ